MEVLPASSQQKLAKDRSDGFALTSLRQRQILIQYYVVPRELFEYIDLTPRQRINSHNWLWRVVVRDICYGLNEGANQTGRKEVKTHVVFV